MPVNNSMFASISIAPLTCSVFTLPIDALYYITCSYTDSLRAPLVISNNDLSLQSSRILHLYATAYSDTSQVNHNIVQCMVPALVVSNNDRSIQWCQYSSYMYLSFYQSDSTYQRNHNVQWHYDSLSDLIRSLPTMHLKAVS